MSRAAGLRGAAARRQDEEEEEGLGKEMAIYRQVAEATGETLEAVCNMREQERAEIIAVLGLVQEESTPIVSGTGDSSKRRRTLSGDLSEHELSPTPDRENEFSRDIKRARTNSVEHIATSLGSAEEILDESSSSRQRNILENSSLLFENMKKSLPSPELWIEESGDASLPQIMNGDQVTEENPSSPIFARGKSKEVTDSPNLDVVLSLPSTSKDDGVTSSDEIDLASKFNDGVDEETENNLLAIDTETHLEENMETKSDPKADNDIIDKDTETLDKSMDMLEETYHDNFSNLQDMLLSQTAICKPQLSGSLDLLASTSFNRLPPHLALLCSHQLPVYRPVQCSQNKDGNADTLAGLEAAISGLSSVLVCMRARGLANTTQHTHKHTDHTWQSLVTSSRRTKGKMGNKLSRPLHWGAGGKGEQGRGTITEEQPSCSKDRLGTESVIREDSDDKSKEDWDEIHENFSPNKILENVNTSDNVRNDIDSIERKDPKSKQLIELGNISPVEKSYNGTELTRFSDFGEENDEDVRIISEQLTSPVKTPGREHGTGNKYSEEEGKRDLVPEQRCPLCNIMFPNTTQLETHASTCDGEVPRTRRRRGSCTSEAR